jgi:hypothetical protein
MKKMMLAGAMLAALVIGAGSASAVSLSTGAKTRVLQINGNAVPGCNISHVANGTLAPNSPANTVLPLSLNLSCNYATANVRWKVTPAKGAIATGTATTLGNKVNYVYQVQQKVHTAAAATLSDYPAGTTSSTTTPRTAANLTLNTNQYTKFMLNVKLTEATNKKPSGVYNEQFTVVIG